MASNVGDQCSRGLTERQIRLDPRLIGLINQHHFAELAFAFGVLGREEVAPTRLCAQNFAARGDLESFRDGFPGLTASNRFRHRERKIAAATRITNSFSPANRAAEAPSSKELTRSPVQTGIGNFSGAWTLEIGISLAASPVQIEPWKPRRRRSRMSSLSALGLAGLKRPRSFATKMRG